MKWLTRVALAAVALSVLLAAGVYLSHEIAQYRTASGRPDIDPQRGVDELFTARIGGIPQWLHVRGQDRRNPVLLYLHGGPGTPMMPFSHSFQNGWEAHFTVAHWDQRGAGKTRYASDPQQVDPTVTFERVFADALEVVELLRSRYGKQKIVLLGHSWGTMLGHALAQERPDLFSLYVATGVVVNVVENEAEGYRYALQLARERGNQQAVAELEALAPYPEVDGSTPEEKTGSLRDWQQVLGVASSRRHKNLEKAMLEFALKSPEYDFRDVGYFLDEPLWPELEAWVDRYNARDWKNPFQMPVVYLLGRHDWQTPSTIAADYFEALDAPVKKLLWLEDSSHAPMVDEPERFADLMIREVRPLAGDP